MPEDDSSATAVVPQTDPVQSLINAQNAVLANPKFAPDPVTKTTHCSEASYSIARQVGMNTVGILGDAHGENFNANTQIQNLANPAHGYVAVDPAQAQTLATQGILAFATQLGAVHGHVTTVRPEGVPGDAPRGNSGPLLANVGQFVGVARQSIVFTPAHGAIVYYAPGS
jgi:hypothetical protein